MNNERIRRVGSNEAIFRELNAQLAGLREASELSCVCECGELSCVESIVMTFYEYRQLRADEAAERLERTLQHLGTSAQPIESGCRRS